MPNLNINKLIFFHQQHMAKRKSSEHEFLAEKQDFNMDLLDFPEEVLLKILSNLDQETVHLTVGLVCKRFLQLTRSPQMLKCVQRDTGDLTATQFQSLLVMLRDNKHLIFLILEDVLDVGDDNVNSTSNVLEVFKAVAPHGSLRHLCFVIGRPLPVADQKEWMDVFSQICAKLTTFRYYNFELETPGEEDGFDCLAPLANAKYLTTLTLSTIPSSETFRQMADNYTCLQNVNLYGFDCSESSDVAYFLEEQSQTLTSLKIDTTTENPLPAISKCRNLKKLWLESYDFYGDTALILNDWGSLSNLKCLCLDHMSNTDIGNSIKAAKFQHLTEIELIENRNLTDNDVSQIAKSYGQQV
jgi:hypothetical protein